MPQTFCSGDSGIDTRGRETHRHYRDLIPQSLKHKNLAEIHFFELGRGKSRVFFKGTIEG
jgi:hypothetical protein